MRKYLRSIARANMVRAGMSRINKPKTNSRGVKGKSYFAEHWKEWI